MRIALDVMGTDYGPKELVLGAVMAVKEYNCDVVLVGDEEIIRKLLKEYKAEDNPHLSVQHASEVIGMREHPGIAVKTKKDASIVVATDLPLPCCRKKPGHRTFCYEADQLPQRWTHPFLFLRQYRDAPACL